MIRVSCPKCKTILQVEDKHAGQVVACSKCNTSMRLPPAPPALPPSPPVPMPPVSKSAKPTPLAATTRPADKGNSQKAPGSTAKSPSKDQANNLVGRLKTFWRDARTPIKAAVIGGTSVMFLSCFLCCGLLGFITFRPSPDGKAKDGGAAQDPPNIAKLDFAKGPNGEEVAKVEEAKRVFFAFQNKGQTKVRHGLFTEFFDKEKTKKKVEGNFFAGEWHGKVTRWYGTGELRNERLYDRGKGVGTHKGFKKDGSLEWELTFDTNGIPLMSKASVEAFVNQWADFIGRDDWQKGKSDGRGIFHEERGNPGSREPTGAMPVTIYSMSNIIEAKHSEVVRLFGTPKNMFAKATKNMADHYVYVYQCQDAYIRLSVSRIPFDFSKLPQPDDKVMVLGVIFVGGDLDY